MIEASAPDFWRLWYVGLIVSIVRWLETVAVGIFVYQRTDSAFLVSMMTMLRLLPMGLFGVFLGALAERFDRGRTLLVVVLLMSVTSTVLAILDQTGLEGAYVVNLEWAPEAPAPVDDAITAPSIYAAVQEQLGLKLEARKTPLPVIVVDFAEKVPIGN
jgi:uncharacterized protein (TIGR03435 family)